jgi:uncharacterized membrane protein YvlD (DUF360 family)
LDGRRRRPPDESRLLSIFILLINPAMLALTAWVAGAFGLEVDLDSFQAAFVAALLISFVSVLLNVFVGRPLRRALR